VAVHPSAAMPSPPARTRIETSWLRDFLAQQIPDVRIMTVGYNADAASGHSTAETIDHAKSLLASLVIKERSQMYKFMMK